MRRFLLCPPDFFDIRYEINPWMSRARGADRALAAKQWRGLESLLRRLDCQLELVTPRPEWPDMVFTANAGLVLGNQVVLASFRHPERQGEAAYYREWFLEHEYSILEMPRGMAFEGEGDALFCGETLYCAGEFRTDGTTHDWLRGKSEREVVSLKLCQPHFYHLDTCFCPLGEDRVAWYPGAFDAASRRLIQERIHHRIDVNKEEAMRFACNAVVLGRDIVLPEGCPKLRADLESVGLASHELPMSEFIKAGGACKCLVLQLSR